MVNRNATSSLPDISPSACRTRPRDLSQFR